MEESGATGRIASGKLILVRGRKHPEKTGITKAMKQILTVKINLAIFMFDISIQKNFRICTILSVAKLD